MKIHIVQKGDTLWKIAKKYGVNFEELKQLNSQLSNPDMIMPGMKIKVPTAGVPVKKEAPIMPVKEAPKAVHPFAEMPPVTLPVVEEVKEQPKVVSPAMYEAPAMPMPQMYQPQPEIDVNNYYMVNMAMMNQTPPQLPPKPANVLPGMMIPEESPEQVEAPVEELPAPPVYQQPYVPPVYQQPYCPPPPCCGPAVPMMPGAGFNYQAQQPPYGYQMGYPQAGGQGGYPEAVNPGGYPQAMNPGMYPQAVNPAAYSETTNPGGYPQAMNPGGYPQAVNPAMMLMPYMPEMDDPDELESPPDNMNFNYPDENMSPAEYNPQMMGGFSGGNPDAGYQAPFMPNTANCVPISPVLPGAGFGYQPNFGMPQMGGMQGVPPYAMPGGYQPNMPQTMYNQGFPGNYQQPFMPPNYQASPFGAAQPAYPMYPYGYQRQNYPYYNYDEESNEYGY